MWIKREISNILDQNKAIVLILVGPRQVGKSTLLTKLEPEGFDYVSLDDLSQRSMARENPRLFLSRFSKNLIIDEAQYAPELFPQIKLIVDQYKLDPKKNEKPRYRITGSNQILMDRNIKESLSGRASYYDMNGLTFREVNASVKNLELNDFFSKGGWPELYQNSEINPKRYLDDYIRTYVEKDIVTSAQIAKSKEFTDFLKLAAGRSGTLINYSEISNILGLKTVTVKNWFSILERMGLIVLLPGFSSNLSKRLIKAPKLHFLDIGLCLRLQGWSNNSLAPFWSSPQVGPMFESFIFSEFYKKNQNLDLGYSFYHLRNKEKQEVDLLIEKENKSYELVEIKLTRPKSLNVEKHFPKNLTSLFKEPKFKLISSELEKSFLNDEKTLSWSSVIDI